MSEALEITQTEARVAGTEAYGRLRLADKAGVSEVVDAINYHEGARRFLRVVSPNEEFETEAMYQAAIIQGVKNDLVHCITSDGDPLEAIQVFATSIGAINTLSINSSLRAAWVAELDETFLHTALDELSDPKSGPLEKVAGVTLSLAFAREQRGVEKTQMIIEGRLEASKDVTGARLEAFEQYLKIGKLDFRVQVIDSTMSESIQKAAHVLERGRQAIDDGAKVGQKAAAVTILASMGVVGGGAMGAAAADVTPTVAQTETTNGADVPVIQSIPTGDLQSALETPVVAVVTVQEAPAEAATIATPGTVEASLLAITPTAANIDPATVEPATIGNNEVQAEIDVLAIAPVAAERDESADEAVAATIAGPGVAQAEQTPTVELTPSAYVTPELAEGEEAVAPTAPTEAVTLVAPNSDVNVAAGETPQETITRIVSARDINAASYAIRQNYLSPDGFNQPPVNPTLTSFVTADIVTLKSEIPAAAHADPTYTERAFTALAYFDAITQNPALLDNPEVAAIVAGYVDQGEDYRNKLFASYLAEAKAVLSAENAGAYANIAEQYRPSLETLYAYIAMAAMSDEVQAQQIQAIKDEEARIAAEEEAKRKAAELAAQGLSEIEAIAADEKRLVLTAIDRAEQQGLITARYAAVYRLVIDSEGPGARAAAAGMVGNCMAEAAGCDPMIVERGNGIGYGIFQWSFGRRTTLEQTAAAQGINVGDLGFQVRYAISESKNRTGRDDKSINEWAGMMSQTDPGAAAEFWRWNFERPKDHLSSTNTRIQVANEVYAHVNGQMDAIRGEAAAAKAERERLAAEEAERQRIAEEQRRAAEADGDIRYRLPNALAIKAEMEVRHGGISGRLDPSELAERASFGKHGDPKTILLHPAAAEGFDNLNAAFQAHFGEPIRVTDHYRSYDAQVNVKAEKPTLAAKPGASNHGWGMAIDFASNINTEGSDQHEWMEQNAHKYGWVNPGWAHDGTSKGGAEEPWHWEFEGNQANYEKTNS